MSMCELINEPSKNELKLFLEMHIFHYINLIFNVLWIFFIKHYVVLHNEDIMNLPKTSQDTDTESILMK